jgi:hypothetical protein
MYKNILVFDLDGRMVKLNIRDIGTLSQYIKLLLNDNIPFQLHIKEI